MDHRRRRPRSVGVPDDRGNPLALPGPDAAEHYQAWQEQLGARMEELLEQWEGEIQVFYQELFSILDSEQISEVQTVATRRARMSVVLCYQQCYGTVR